MASRRAGLILLYSITLTAAAQPDTTARADSAYNIFIATRYNAVEFYERAAVEQLFNRWQSDTVSNLVVAHLGDSHVQPGVFPDAVREYMQSAKGFGGYGMMFPYSAARTYSPLQYSAVHYGGWQAARGLEPNPKLPLGVSGMTIRTYDSVAGFSLKFKAAVPAHYKKLKLYFRGGNTSYDIRVVAGTGEVVVPASKKPEDVPFVEVMLPDTASTIHLHVLKTHRDQQQFEFYGLSLESETGQGLIYHSLGVGGAPFTSLLKELLLDTQLPALEPDLVILDFGTNDFLYTERIAPDLGREIVQTIRWIKQLVPGVTILLTTTQDMDRSGYNIEAAREYSGLIRGIARTEGCALYDWYRISGGQYAMGKWVKERLARPDHIHLTADGYALKGKLFTSAFEHSVNRYLEAPGLDSLVLYTEPSDSVMVDSLIRNASRRQVATTKHHVVSGESLSTIAEKYGVKVEDIMRVNRLSSTRIIAGSYLTIEYFPYRPVARTQGPRGKTNAVPYRVKSGDTLSEIAEQYNVSVKAIKKLNGLRTSRIVEGKTLWIPKA
jgi:LysM repeat protein